MQFRSLSSLSRILIVTCAAGLGTSSLLAQDASNTSSSSAQSSTQGTPTSTKPMAPTEPYASRIDVFAGYSYLAPHGSITVPGGVGIGVNGPVKYSSVDYGALGSVNYFFNRYVGAQLEIGAHPDGNNDGAYEGALGMVFRYPTGDITPFVHANAGAVRLGGAAKEPYTWGPTLAVGGGLDYNLGKHFGIRVFQADYTYYHADFGPQNPYPTGGRANLDNARLSAGLLYHLGSIVPPPPVMYACTVSPASVYPGDPITITGTATNLNPKKTASYTWTGTNGVKVTGDTSTGNVDTNGLNPGSYTVTGHVSEGVKAGMFADCTSTFEVKQFEPPTISCSANPTTVNPGDSATITAQGVSPQNRPLTYTYSATAGTVNGTGNTATLATTGAPAGSITVTCNVADDKGQTATSTTSVSVQAPPPPPAPKTSTLCSITFGRDKKRPARVDNEAKACLDDVALNLQRQTDATAVLVGEADPSEKGAAKLAPMRAVNTKEYLVKEKGIDASRISVRTGTQGNKEVENYLVPAGATFDTDIQGTTAVDESAVMATPRTGKKPMHHHKKKAAPAKQ